MLLVNLTGIVGPYALHLAFTLPHRSHHTSPPHVKAFSLSSAFFQATQVINTRTQQPIWAPAQVVSAPVERQNTVPTRRLAGKLSQ